MANEDTAPRTDADDGAAHSEDCPCPDCKDQRELLDHGLDEPSHSDEFPWACDDTEEDPDDGHQVAYDDPVDYSDPGLLNKLFPPLFHGDWPVPYVKKHACTPAEIGDLRIYAFECYEEHQLTHPAVKGVAVFRDEALVSFGIQDRDGACYRIVFDGELVTSVQHAAGPESTALWYDCDSNDQVMLGLLASRLRQDSGILFMHGSELDLQRAQAFRLL